MIHFRKKKQKKKTDIYFHKPFLYIVLVYKIDNNLHHLFTMGCGTKKKTREL